MPTTKIDLTALVNELDALSHTLAETFHDGLCPGLTCAEAEQLARTMTAAGYPDTAEIILIGHSFHDGEEDWHNADQTEYDADAAALVRKWTEGDWEASAVPDEEPEDQGHGFIVTSKPDAVVISYDPDQPAPPSETSARVYNERYGLPSVVTPSYEPDDDDQPEQDGAYVSPSGDIHYT